MPGGGQQVELALKDVAAATPGHLGMIGDACLNALDRAKAGNALYGAYGQDFICADGRRVLVTGLTARQWSGLVTATDSKDAVTTLEDRPGVSLDVEGNRWRFHDDITDILRSWFAARRVTDLERGFNDAGLIWSEFRTVCETLDKDPDLGAENPMFSEVAQPGLGRFPVPSHPAVCGAFDRKQAQAAPMLGSNTEAVPADVEGYATPKLRSSSMPASPSSPNTQRRGRLHSIKALAQPGVPPAAHRE